MPLPSSRASQNGQEKDFYKGFPSSFSEIELVSEISMETYLGHCSILVNRTISYDGLNSLYS